MRKFNEKQVKQITGATQRNLDRWVGFGLITPVGNENGRYYSTVQCLALTTVVRARNQGASFERIASLLQFLCAVSFEHLEAEMDAGRTMPVPAVMLGLDWCPGIMIEPPKAPKGTQHLVDALDMRLVFGEVMHTIEKLSSTKAVKRVQRRRTRKRNAVIK